MQWDKATNIILIASLATFACFACLGFYQLIKRKSLKKIDKNLLLAIIPLALMAITYFVFNKIFVLNTRPNGSGEPSFPSSHTMVAATIFLLVALNLPKYLKNKTVIAAIDIIMFVMTILMAVGRVLANKHWVSDVIAGLIFAAIFGIVYYFLIRTKKEQK